MLSWRFSLYHAMIMITDISKIQLAWTLPELDVAPVERPIDFLGSCAGFYPTPLGSVGYADAYL
jgi:hypothetical protein